jgi:hypothetical protein
MRRLRPSLQNSAPLYIFVCVLLALSFLFNPYLFAPGSEGGLHVRHHASYRATVGSSELEKCSPPVGQDSREFVAHFVVGILSVLPDAPSHSPLFSRPELPLGRELFCSNLWFRPPPAA